MNGAYTATVRQLLDIAPVVFTTPHFAIKGGTALNLFLHDLPRLSVDIDVVFTDHSLGREAALQAMGYEVRQRRNSAGNESKLMVIGPLAEVKVEVNEVFAAPCSPCSNARSHLPRRRSLPRRSPCPCSPPLSSMAASSLRPWTGSTHGICSIFWCSTTTPG